MNQVHSHPEQPQMQVEVILASSHTRHPDEKPLYTVRMRYPRPIHGEIMTHRVFGRNARSSRAVPVKTMLNEVRTIPYVPWHWLKNKSGMQGTEPLTKEEQEKAETLWRSAANTACHHVDRLFDPNGLNIHKQNPNRLLEPFSWIDTLITSNRWDNFLWLRDHKDAEPHLQDLARLVKTAFDEAGTYDLEPGQWHLPYITMDDRQHASEEFTLNSELYWNFLRRISAARCARISYKPFDGDASYQKEISRYDMLVTSDRVHASPLEHQATPDIYSVEYGGWDEPSLHGNLPGWIQARKLIANECYHG